MSGTLSNGPLGAVDGLPKQFVTSLRILFDILDEDRTGFVRLRDIETRWHEEGVTGLPSGVIEALRKVAPRNGRLSFDNFVTGLKLALLKNNGAGPPAKLQVGSGQVRQTHGKRHQNPPVTAASNMTNSNNQKISQSVKPQKSPDYVNIGPTERNPQKSNQSTGQTQYRNQPKMGSQAVLSANLAAIESNNAVPSQNIELRNQIFTREQMQQAQMKTSGKKDQVQYNSSKNDGNRKHTYNHRPSTDVAQSRKEFPNGGHIQRPKSANIENQRPHDYHHGSRYSDYLPGRPDRPPPYRRPNEADVPPVLPPKNINSRIMNELKNWQREHKIGQSQEYKDPPRMRANNSDSKLNDHHAIYVNIDQVRQREDGQKSSSSVRKPVRRQNSRRHTLSSGIDYNVIRRMKQLEQEKDVLLQGLEVIDRARDWYLKEIASLSDKQTFAEKSSYSDVTLQSHQERMDFVRSRITDVNLNLKTLMETSESGFPAHMNLAIRSSVHTDDNSVRWLKDQNKQLTQEVGNKSDKITQLEKEKASLIRDLFEARSKHKTNYDDTTFM